MLHNEKFISLVKQWSNGLYMAQRYQELLRLPQNIYSQGSPDIIKSGAFLKDTVTGKVLTQLEFRNLDCVKRGDKEQ